MPRIMAPPPSGEFSVSLIKPFDGKITHSIQITGEPNRVATIVVKNESGGNSNEKEGQMSAEDVNELMSLTSQLSGFPSDGSKDLYGLNVRLELHTFDVQWTNAEDTPSGTELAAETKSTFKDVVDSIEAAGRTFAKKDKAI